MYTIFEPRDGILNYMRSCQNCSSALLKRHQIRFCSNQCQSNYKYHQYILIWKSNNEAGIKNAVTKNISGYLKRHLLENFGEKCSMCGWNKKHPITGRVPIEVDHIDGNGENNSENNLRLLCPNCHALTPSFRNLNKGKGRTWRRKK